MPRVHGLLFLCLTLAGPFGEGRDVCHAQDRVVLTGHQGAVMMADFAGASGHVVTAAADHAAIVWNAQTGRQEQKFSQHTGPLYCLAVSADGRTLVTGAQDNTVRVWDLALSQPIRRFTEPGAALTDLSLGSDGKTLICGSADRTLRILDTSTTPQITTRSGHDQEITAVAIRSDMAAFASADLTGRIMIWSPDLDQPTSTLFSHPGSVRAAQFTVNNQQLLTLGDDAILRLWQPSATGSKVLLTGDAPMSRLSVQPNQPITAVLSDTHVIRLLNAQSGEVRELPRSDAALTDIHMTSNGAVVLSGTDKGRINVQQISDGMMMGSVGGHEGRVSAVVSHPDNQLFVSASSDGTARLWKMPVNSAPANGHTAAIHQILRSPNAQWTATCSEDKSVRIWNSAGNAVAQFTSHTQPVVCCAVRDDGALVASGDADGTVWIWNPANGSPEGVIKAHGGRVNAVAFSSDRNLLLSAGTDGTVRAWTLPLPKQIPAEGEAAVNPTWTYQLPENQSATGMARWTAERGLVVLPASGNQLLQLNWNGQATGSIPSPAGRIRTFDVCDVTSEIAFATETGAVVVIAADGSGKSVASGITEVTCIRWDHQGKRLAVARNQPLVRIVDRLTGRVLEEVSQPSPVTTVDWSQSEAGLLHCSGAANEGAIVPVRLQRWLDCGSTPQTDVVMMPDQQHVIVAGQDGILKQWNISTGEQKAAFDAGGAIVEACSSVSPVLIAAATNKQTLSLWKSDGTLVRTMSLGFVPVSVTLNSEGSRLAVSGSDGIVRVYETTGGLLLEEFRNHTAGKAVRSARFLPDQMTLITCGEDHQVVLQRTSCQRALRLDEKSVSGFASVNGGGQVISCGADGRMVLRTVANGNEDRVYQLANDVPLRAAVRPDNQRIATAMTSGRIAVWNINDGSAPLLILEGATSVSGMKWSLDGRRLAVVRGASVEVYGPPLPGTQPPVELILWQSIPSESDVSAVQFSADGRTLFCTLKNGRLDEWAIAGPEQRRQFNHGGAVYGVAVTSDGTTAVSCSADQTVRVWDTVTGQQRFQLNGHQGPVHAIALSQDETLAVSSGADGTLRLWDIAGGRQLKQLIAFDSTMYSVAINPKSGQIAAAGADRKVHLIDMISGAELLTMSGHTDYIHSVQFSPDGGRLLSYGYAGQLRFWNPADGQLIREERVGRVGNTARFSTDGRQIVVANGDGTATVFPAP